SDTGLPFLDKSFTPSHLQTFINNQIVLIKSQFVIKAALAPREVAGLGWVRSQSNKTAWLFKSLEAQNPPGTSLLVLTLQSSGDVDELEAVLDMVVMAYQNEVVAADVISSIERRRSAAEHYKELKVDFGKLVERQQALAAEVKDQDASTEMRLLQIKMGVLEDMLKEAEKVALYSNLRDAISISPVTILQSATVVPNP